MVLHIGSIEKKGASWWDWGRWFFDMFPFPLKEECP
jgi:hypothetical protein